MILALAIALGKVIAKVVVTVIKAIFKIPAKLLGIPEGSKGFDSGSSGSWDTAMSEEGPTVGTDSMSEEGLPSREDSKGW